MRFQAPEHVSAIHCFAGELRADENGVLEITEEQLQAGVVPILCAAGWMPIEEAKPTKAPAQTSSQRAVDGDDSASEA